LRVKTTGRKSWGYIWNKDYRRREMGLGASLNWREFGVKFYPFRKEWSKLIDPSLGSFIWYVDLVDHHLHVR